MPPPGENPIGVAMQWVARITAAALMMVLPGIGAQWLDSKLGTRVLTLPGFILGLVAGVAYLLMVTKANTPPRKGGER